MSVVIIGGNDRMKRLYKDTCQFYGYKAKVFTQMEGTIRNNFGSPDLVILFTNTVAHKMVSCALSEAKRCSAKIERCHSSSITALHTILSSQCVEA